jgi:hypothetical protein
MVNAGIFATLLEQVVAGVVIGALSVGTPSSASYPVFVFLSAHIA